MGTPKEILKQYWGYDAFRPPQEEIIQSILDGKDTMAILPTGGGKSLCYQVPALVLNKLVIVVSPLIALMQDQVEDLKKTGVKAIAIHSGLHQREIDIALDNAIYGDTRLLYLAPERLGSELFRERLKKMDLGFLAIDEAHCISQWGKDFRPSYLKVPEIRAFFSKPVPTLALTASATPRVKKDIEELLGLAKPSLFSKTVKRENLSLAVYHEENKRERLLKAMGNVPGTGIVYVRNRKSTRETAHFLEKQGISATFYHAGLSFDTKEKNQLEWLKGKKRIMVCTNAFGMGINKPDVRLVVHLDPPDSLEAYYQEVGRAGRDGKLSFGLTLVSKQDLAAFEMAVEEKYPSKEELIRTYNQISNRFKLAVGSGLLHQYAIELQEMAEYLNTKATFLFKSLKLLEKMGVMEYIGPQNWQSTLHLLFDHQDLYKFQVEQPHFDHLLKSILRLYGGGLFTQYLPIQEKRIAEFGMISPEEVIKKLKDLDRQKVLDYNQGIKGPKILYPQGRVGSRSLEEAYFLFIEQDKKSYRQRLEAALTFYKNPMECRMNQVSVYFGEEKGQDCGICDFCIRQKNKADLQNTIIEIRGMLMKQKELGMESLLRGVSKAREQLILEAIREGIDQGWIDQKESDIIKFKG